jgi:LmbE family N-acetylglucosaminyl deacetylase
MPKNIIIFCAHNDDQIIGAGGTIAKYARKGINIHTVIFSFGELSHPWMKGHVTTEIRKKEAEEADKVLGGKEIVYLGLREGKFIEQFDEDERKELFEMILKLKPIKIFTHSASDPHPDHRAVHHIIKQILNDSKYKCDTYAFDVWNPVNIRAQKLPKLVVDVTSTFKAKIDAFRCHKSQKLAFFSLIWNVYLRAFMEGLHYNAKHVEVFYKIK